MMEIWTKPLRDKLYLGTCTTAKGGIPRFYNIFNGIKQVKANNNVSQCPRCLKGVFKVEDKTKKH